MRYILNAQNIWEIGKREKQEDSIFPEYGKANENDRLFILCDGMGGHSAGEIASSTVCNAMSSYILEKSSDAEGYFSNKDFENALDNTFDALDKKDNGNAKKMGTTLTFLKFHSHGCTIAHMGDSRVYHIRPGENADETEILYQTKDHSLVNDLIKIGELTAEEAKNSPQKNIITRAMQPNMEHRPKADIYNTDDIEPGDYFMLCSDGILENIEDDNIRYIFSEKTGDIANKAEMLIKITKENNDNHSAILVQITDVIHEANILPITETEEETAGNIEPEEEHTGIPAFYKQYKSIIIMILIATSAICGYAIYRNLQKKDTSKQEQVLQNDQKPKKNKTKKKKESAVEKEPAYITPDKVKHLETAEEENKKKQESRNTDIEKETEQDYVSEDTTKETPEESEGKNKPSINIPIKPTQKNDDIPTSDADKAINKLNKKQLQ